MALSYSTKQRLIYFLWVVGLVVATHFAYIYLKPQWIAYRQAESYYDNQEWENAIQYYQISISKGIDNPRVYSQLGAVYSKTKNYPLAVQSYEKYLELRPGELWAMRAYAGVLTANGDFERASREYQKILEVEAQQKKQ